MVSCGVTRTHTHLQTLTHLNIHTHTYTYVDTHTYTPTHTSWTCSLPVIGFNFRCDNTTRGSWGSFKLKIPAKLLPLPPGYSSLPPPPLNWVTVNTKKLRTRRWSVLAFFCLFYCDIFIASALSDIELSASLLPPLYCCLSAPPLSCCFRSPSLLPALNALRCRRRTESYSGCICWFPVSRRVPLTFLCFIVCMLCLFYSLYLSLLLSASLCLSHLLWLLKFLNIKVI